MDYSHWTFVMSVLETKLDQTTMFQWQKHNQGLKEVPDYLELLEFLDLWARATENTKGSLSRSTLLTHRRRGQLDHLMWPTLTKRVWHVRRPIIRSTPVNPSKRYRTNEK